MPRGKKASGPVAVEATVHGEAKRTNIPTSELEGFLKPEDRAPKKILYPRDPSLDPQLVWKGKDEQDQHPLEVPAVPIYIQEKIASKALIEDLRKHTNATAETEQVNLFSDFNGIQFEDLVNFYQHQQNWSNRMILGDSLLVMTSLAEKEALKGQVQCIYMDPPYGIKFGSNWQVSTRKRDVKDGKVEDATRQPEQVKAFRDTWQLGINSYLTYLRDRLAVAQSLLSPTGSLFLQIGEQNVHLVRAVLDEVFGAHNFCALIPFAKTASTATNLLASEFDYLLWYARDRESVKYRQLFLEKGVGTFKSYAYVEDGSGQIRRLTADEKAGRVALDAGLRPLQVSFLASQDPGRSEDRFYTYRGKTYDCGAHRHWKTTNPSGLDRLALADRLLPLASQLNYKRYLSDFPATPLTADWSDTGSAGFSSTDPKVYVVQTDSLVIQRCIIMTTDPGDLVVDPTCGSGTTAYVAEMWGRRWITVDTSRVALALARSRLMSARYPYFRPTNPNDLRLGFVYRQVSHITLKSIANNPHLREGMTPTEVDHAIARHADSETLYDQPEEDPRVVRVAGPFTVESLSPHLLATPDENNGSGSPEADVDRFQTLVLDHLRTAGVQNTVRRERLEFISLETWPGARVHAIGEYVESGVTKRAAICIGPEYGTVTSDLVREAAKEAVKHFDVLVVCGFAFDGYVAEESKQLGNLTILRATMNPDISLGQDLLKKTGTANLFIVFGEPDVKIEQAAGKCAVKIRGLDVYDPTTGELRSHTTDEIACWFIDTDYNGESFFVRQAYFLGSDDPFDDLKRALRADVSEEAWSSINSDTSRPFPLPSTGKIAVKVINHYGDEVLKVYEVSGTGG